MNMAKYLISETDRLVTTILDALEVVSAQQDPTVAVRARLPSRERWPRRGISARERHRELESGQRRSCARARGSRATLELHAPATALATGTSARL